jgi:tRNA(Ile)-lysidine synthase
VWPLGAPGARKLQDVFVDLRVPRAARGQVPLVISGDRVVWVCGLVVAEEGRIRADTNAIVRLSANSPQGSHRW